jgi:Fic family protein
MQGHHNVQSTLVSMAAKDGRNEASQLIALRSFFASIDNMRASLNLDVEEMLLYLGVGYLNTERIQQIGSNGYITSTNVSSVADFMKIPKETARRKIKRLIALGLIENKRGVVVSDVSRWFAFVRQMPLCTHQTNDTDKR